MTEQAVGEKVLKSLDPQPAARRHRPPGTDRPDGAGRPLAAPAGRRRDRADALRPAGLGQDDHLRQAGAAAQASAAASRCWWPPTCSAPRPSTSCTCSASSSACRSTPTATAKDPVAVCHAAVKQAKKLGADVVILDTAGRLHIDEELMEQLDADRPPRAARPGLPGRRRA